MKNIVSFMKEFIEDESGLTAVEYAIAGALVVGTLVTAFTQLGTAVGGQIENLCEAAGGSGASCG